MAGFSIKLILQVISVINNFNCIGMSNSQCVINAQNAVRDFFDVSVVEAVIEEITSTGTADIEKHIEKSRKLPVRN